MVRSPPRERPQEAPTWRLPTPRVLEGLSHPDRPPLGTKKGGFAREATTGRGVGAPVGRALPPAECSRSPRSTIVGRARKAQIHGTHGPDLGLKPARPQTCSPSPRPSRKPSQVPSRPPGPEPGPAPPPAPPPPRPEPAPRARLWPRQRSGSRAPGLPWRSAAAPRRPARGASGIFGRGRGAHLSLLRPPRLCRLRSGMVRLAWTVALGLFPSFSLAKQWLLRIRCREDFTIRPLGSETRKTSAALLRAAAAARRSQNGAAVAARFYRRRTQATPPAPPGTRPQEGARPPGNQMRPPPSAYDWRTARGWAKPLRGLGETLRVPPLEQTSVCRRAEGAGSPWRRERARRARVPRPHNRAWGRGRHAGSGSGGLAVAWSPPWSLSPSLGFLPPARPLPGGSR